MGCMGNVYVRVSDGFVPMGSFVGLFIYFFCFLRFLCVLGLSVRVCLWDQYMSWTIAAIRSLSW